MDPAGADNLGRMSLAPAPYGRMLTAMVTPFKPDGSVDLDAVAAVAAHLVENGNDGVVVSGTTGESPTTTVAEDAEILRAVKDGVAGRGNVIAGVGTNSTAHSAELARNAAKVGVDAMLLVTPYYNKPGPAGNLRHFTEVAAAAPDLPVMLYDVPGRTGQAIAMETYEAARKIETVTSVKHATGDPTATVALRQLGYDVYSGDDGLILGYLAHGACGLVSVVGHAAGRQLTELIEAFGKGDVESALASYTKLLPAFTGVMGVPNYGATTAKAALQLLGVLDNRRVRGPLAELDDTEVADLSTALQKAGLL